MWRGHVWTLAPWLASGLKPVPAPVSRHWMTQVEDSDFGSLRLTGRFHPTPAAGGAVVVVHGLGGDAESRYAREAARQAERAGLACLRINLRGADRRGEDYYHAGLTADLHAAFASEDLASYESLYLLGYSMGGHIALRLASEPHDPRVRAVAAVCPPLDLARAAAAIDRRRRAPYRHHVLRGLKDMYRRVAERRPVPAPLEEAMAIRTFREWDDRIVAPRHGFADAEDYWRKASAGPRLGGVTTPTLVVHAAADPMVLAETVRPSLENIETVQAVWVDRGGHVGFPADLDLGFGGTRGLEAQVLAWLSEH